MSRTLKDTIASDFVGANVTAGLGQEITITATGGTTYSPIAIVTVEKARRRDVEKGTELVWTRTATFALAIGPEFETGTSKAINMTATIDGKDYAVENIHRQLGSIRLDLYRTAINDRTRTKYRGGR